MAPQTEQKIYVGIGLDFETGGLDCRECACTQIALQAVRFDTWQVFDRYQAYIAPYGKQDAGLPRRKVLRTRHEQAKGQEYVPMKYEQAALDYSAITMEMLRTQGMDMKKVAGEVIAFAKRATLSKGNQCKPVLVGQNIAFDIGFLQQLVNYAGLAAEFEKTFSGSRDYYGNFQPHYIDTLALGRLAFAAGYTQCRREVKRGESRLDACLTGPDLPPLWVECKNVTMVEDGVACFPDAATERGQKHLRELMDIVRCGERAAMFYLVQRPDGHCFGPADVVDPAYAALFYEAMDAGVEIYPYRASVSPAGIELEGLLPVASRPAGL